MSSNGILQQSKAQPTTTQPQPPSFLQKKGLLGGSRGGPASIVSPTDNVLSPCSAKLSGAKQKHFGKGKPVLLASQLSQLASSGSNQSVKSDAKIDF
ncbi:uncharacterized protein I303_102553 [Kwoniella dejecticola CBS 10117]|uniref:Uncharacterized protein n=1 Tax=Kwoniella dejecticola CBS 10117 TaxID=1296121 RepID=A0A1A6A925_9TREE|nr:uncharacterized protein I303_02567 [Kwoniella dejecticola CBS 10117]OBR86559.1 hypothetical protein I303_02567 [Kwoniella dejecticola CBS 10117]